MRVIIFGATGMVGQSVLRACVADARVTAILVVGRSPAPTSDDKVIQIVHGDFLDFTSIGPELAGYDACLFCLGVSAAGMSEPAYRRVTYFTTMAAARVLSDHSPSLRFLYISGAGTDSTERGRLMWARVKGETENAVLALPFDGYALRPGYIQPRDGATSRNRLYRNMYRLTGHFYPVLRSLAPRYVIGSDELARAMLNIADVGARQRILDSAAISRLA